MARAALGWDLCEEKRFADQIRGGVVADATCSGTLIDKNLVLTAAHCFRDQFTNEIKPYDIEDWRIVFNYVQADRGKTSEIVRARDVYRFREVLSVHVGLADFSIIELLDADGNPIDSVDDDYIPVPIWESDDPPPAIYRSGAIIGVGAQLPQKISLSRSWGWQTDAPFLGAHFRTDTFRGNSGGGVYDVETGALVGVVHAQGEPSLQVTCPGNPDETSWPDCKLLDPSPAPSQLPTESLVWVPEFNNTSSDPEWRECMGWAPHEVPNTLETAIEELMVERFNVTAANVLTSPIQEGLAVSVNTVRRLACDTTAASGSFVDAINQEADAIVAERNAFVSAGSCQSNPGGCPTTRVIPQQRPAAVIHNTELSEAELRATLLNSRLCTGTVVGPRKELWSDLQRLNLENGRELTFHGTTLAGHDYFDSSTDGSNPVPDELYSVQVDEWTILYADTFSGGAELGLSNPGTTFDTVLYVMEANDPTDTDPLLLPSSWSATAPPFDDSQCPNFLRQSQITQVLEPGKRYVLGVTGWNDGQGDFNLHVQSVPSPRNGQLIRPLDATEFRIEGGIHFSIFQAKPFEAIATEANCQNGLDSNEPFDPNCMYSGVPPNVCQRTDAGDFGFVTVSCPESRTDKVRFRVEATSSPFGAYNDDPVAQYWDGQVRHDNSGYVCSDDSKIQLGVPPFFSFLIDSLSSEIGSAGQVRPDSAETFTPSGAGVRVYYAHQFQLGLNWQNLGYTLKVPSDSINDIW